MVVVNKPAFLRCAITDLSPSPDTPAGRMARLREQVRRWAADGIDFVQLREKQLQSGELLTLAETAMQVLREEATERDGLRSTRLLVNGRADVAAAAGADGVHLTARPGELTPGQARRVFAAAGLPPCFVSWSCHSLPDVAMASKAGADLILFGPVFEKRLAGEVVVAGLGLTRLNEVCDLAGPLPVLALGGVTEHNLQTCLEAGAAGVGAIRLFA